MRVCTASRLAAGILTPWLGNIGHYTHNSVNEEIFNAQSSHAMIITKFL